MVHVQIDPISFGTHVNKDMDHTKHMSDISVYYQ